ncbi:glycine cleavage system transcriptional repressor [Ferrimonas sediminum]|uniref:Glycine cleavage system transcriptional repressor n=1 Tax=Ferrimonas sediminum TaxID=718193 RepID=A0A1G8RB00_9GAMM|nr:ACT domain-containing protein [Ferrimonas sediminum]SDJ13550.1 glycine cleavage system transcriptional repressor [Ferrimonas sediminum]
MTQYLAVTAMGTDRPGIVNQLAKLTASCDCDIIDSRMATYGNEFNLIMLVAGSYAAIALMENELPAKAAQLDLLTISKRTSEHVPQQHIARLAVEYSGEDRRGTMRQVTQCLADLEQDLAGMRTHAGTAADGKALQQLELFINIPENTDIDHLEQQLTALGDQMMLDCRIRRMDTNETTN